MDESQFLQVLKPYYEAFAEHDERRRMELLREAMTPDAEIWGPKRVFAGYEQISEKITGFHNNWPGCLLVLVTGLNIFLNSARVGGAIIGPDENVRASGEAVIELATDGRIQRVLPFWEPLPPLPASWPAALAGPARQGSAA
ncbi:nuclear transport factor 2 family protein [Aquabacterium humicola]|uniref:nuclear transport factor 2 family protein n=1 Tax=Aquabacterium humicola TaxID=3237377 RepID=UPI0025431E7F|nr:nuclear transport factor 2 family protein [Rubrivivax pictus]